MGSASNARLQFIPVWVRSREGVVDTVVGRAGETVDFFSGYDSTSTAPHPCARPGVPSPTVAPSRPFGADGTMLPCSWIPWRAHGADVSGFGAGEENEGYSH